MANLNVPRRDSVVTVERALRMPAVTTLIARLEDAHTVGRRGYGPRRLVGLTIVKMLYSIETWTKAVSWVSEHPVLLALCDCATPEDLPSVDACYRFSRKLVVHREEFVLPFAHDVQADLRALDPKHGRHVGIDSTTIPAYAVGQRKTSKDGFLREKFSDPDASFGHRGATGTRGAGSHYSYRVHVMGTTDKGRPVAWYTHTGKDGEKARVPVLFRQASEHDIHPETCSLDKNYDAEYVYAEIASWNAKPVIPLQKQSKRFDEHRVPTCVHGRWVFSGADTHRNASKYRCPTGQCKPWSTWISADRLHPLIPRSSARFGHLYGRRTVLEGLNGNLKTYYKLENHFVRRLHRVRLHVDLTMISRLLWAVVVEQYRTEGQHVEEEPAARVKPAA